MRPIPWLMSPAEAPSLPSPSPAHRCLNANAITVIFVFLCALICSLMLHVSVRIVLRSSPLSGRLLLLRTTAGATDLPPSHEPRVKPSESQLAVCCSSEVDTWTGAECCAICLAEFEEGEKVRVLATCSHEFHPDCVERWWISSASCPTCRRTCSVEEKPVKLGLEQGIGE